MHSLLRNTPQVSDSKPSGRGRGEADAKKNKNKNFFEKVWKLRNKVINFATLFASGLPGRKGASDKNIESIYNRQVVQEKGSAAAATAA